MDELSEFITKTASALKTSSEVAEKLTLRVLELERIVAKQQEDIDCICENLGYQKKDKKKERCKDCAALISGVHGEWVCDEESKDIHQVDRCPEE